VVECVAYGIEGANGFIGHFNTDTVSRQDRDV
jgi:hypothetical protein